MKLNKRALELSGKGKGFTLIEIIIVLAVIAVLAAIVVPSISGYLSRGEEASLEADQKSIQLAVNDYYVNEYEYPTATGSGGDPGPDTYINFTVLVDAKYLIEVPGSVGHQNPGGSADGKYTWYVDGQGKVCYVEAPPIPTVTTKDATNVTKNHARLNMDYDFKDYGSGDVRFAYKPSGGSWSHTNWKSQSGSGSYDKLVESLSSNTTYYFKAQLRYDSIVIEGEEESFKTEED